jgi:hypothetical protein
LFRYAFFVVAFSTFLLRIVEPSIHLLHHHHEENIVCNDFDLHFHEAKESCSWSDASLLLSDFKNYFLELTQIVFEEKVFEVFNNEYFKGLNTHRYLRGPPVII